MRTIKSVLAMFLLGTVVFLASCGKDEDPPKPAPTITATSTTLSVIADTTTTITVNISAAAGIKDVTATFDKPELGTVEITNKSEMLNQLVATGTIKFTSSFQLGTGTITVVVTDNASLSAQTTIGVTVTDHPAIEVAGEQGDTGTNEYHITEATTWGPHLTYHVTSNVFVEKNASLTLLEGTTVIVDGNFSFTVRGNFYSYGTAENQVLFTVPEDQRTNGNIFAGLWGGINSSDTDGDNDFTADEMVVLYTRIEYTGALGQDWQDIVKLGEIEDSSVPTYALFFNNENGKLIIQNSTFAYSADVAVQVDAGTLLITNNTFVLTGKAGGESIDTKIGTNGDIAYNVFYRAATNGVKYNAKNGSADIRIYNNTAIECGWRQTSHDDHGGSFNAESGAKGVVYNNLIVNCTRGVRFSDGKLPDVAHLDVGYNFHFLNFNEPVVPQGGEGFTPQFYPEDGFIILGNGADDPNDVDSTYHTAHDFPVPVYSGNEFDQDATIGNSEDPMFENFDVTAFDATAAALAEEPENENFPATMDFHLKTGSPALTGGKTDFSPFSASLQADGKTYTTPTPSEFIGAFGKKN